MKKVLIGIPVVLVGLVAAVPFVATLADVQISYNDMYHWVVPKAKKKSEARPEVDTPPKTFDAQKCDELLDLNKFPDTQLNGKLYQGDKASDVIFKSGQARIKGDQVELKFFSSEARVSCKDTDTNGTVPQDFTLVLNLSKSELDSKKQEAAFKFGWDLFGKQPLDFYYVAPGAPAMSAPAASTPASTSAPATAANPMTKQLIAGLVGNIALDAKAGGKVKGKGILCFAQPSPEAKPIPKPADYEEGDALPPEGLRHAIAGNFEIEFCPE